MYYKQNAVKTKEMQPILSKKVENIKIYTEIPMYR